MKKLIVILPFLLMACDRQDAIIARSALTGFLISLALMTIVVPLLANVLHFDPLRIFLESISKFIYLAAFSIGILLTGVGTYCWLSEMPEPVAISTMISGIGFTVGSYYLKKWHEDIEGKEYLKSFFRIVVLAIAVIVAIQVLI